MSDDRDIVKRLYAAVARLGVRDVSDYSVTVSGSDIMDVLSTLEFHAAEIARLRARIAELEAENAGLSANQCLNGIHGDESGNPYCPRIAELEERLIDALNSLNAAKMFILEKHGAINPARKDALKRGIAALIASKNVDIAQASRAALGGKDE